MQNIVQIREKNAYFVTKVIFRLLCYFYFQGSQRREPPRRGHKGLQANTVSIATDTSRGLATITQEVEDVSYLQDRLLVIDGPFALAAGNFSADAIALGLRRPTLTGFEAV